MTVNGTKLAPESPYTLTEGDIVQLGVPKAVDQPEEFVFQFHKRIKIKRARPKSSEDEVDASTSKMASPAKYSMKRIKLEQDGHKPLNNINNKENAVQSTSNWTPFQEYKEKQAKQDQEAEKKLKEVEARLAEMQEILREKERAQEEMKNKLEEERKQRENQTIEMKEKLKEKEEQLEIQTIQMKVKLKEKEEELENEIQRKKVIIVYGLLHVHVGKSSRYFLKEVQRIFTPGIFKAFFGQNFGPIPI